MSGSFQARKALADRQKDLELKLQQQEMKLSSKAEEDMKKARRKSTQAGQRSTYRLSRCRGMMDSSSGDSEQVFSHAADSKQSRSRPRRLQRSIEFNHLKDLHPAEDD